MEPIIDAEEANRAIKIVRHLEPKYRITEVPNPAYAKARKDRQAFSPQRESIRTTNDIPAANLKEVIQQREKRYTLDVLNRIVDICDFCPDCSDCTIAKEMQAIDRCERVKRNLLYYGVITE